MKYKELKKREETMDGMYKSSDSVRLSGGSVAKLLGRWSCNLLVPGSCSSPCCSLDLISVAPQLAALCF